MGERVVRRLVLLLLCSLLSCVPSEPTAEVKPSLRVPDTVPDPGGQLPTAARMEALARDNPIAFLEDCIVRYQRDVKGYSLIMQKQERIGGKLKPKEIIQVHFREKPFSAYLQWLEGAGRAERALYVEGENGGKMLIRPEGQLARTIAGDVVERDVDGPDARQAGRYALNEFGLKKGALRTLASWKAAQEQNALHVEYRGVLKVKEAGDRECYVLRRTRYARPEADGVTELTIYIDKATWLQVGSTLKGEGGKLIGEYFFRDIRLNPDFKPEQFKRAALIP
jgi:hypothetical protein